MSSRQESLHKPEVAFDPDFNHRLAIGSTAVVALVGPPTVGRSHIVTTAVELYDDVLPASHTVHENVPLRLVGVVAEPHVWAYHFMHTFATGSEERRVQLGAAIQTLTWMSEQPEDKLDILYNKIDSPSTATNHLYELIKHGRPVPLADKNRALIDDLLFSAKTIGD